MICDPVHEKCHAHNMSMQSTLSPRSVKVHQVVLPLPKLPRLTSSIMDPAAAATNRSGSFLGTYKPSESLPAQKRIKKRKGPDSASIDRVSHFNPMRPSQIPCIAQARVGQRGICV